MKFGFVVHPLGLGQRALLGVRSLRPWLAVADAGVPPRVARFPAFTSKTGATTSGDVRAIPMQGRTMLRDQPRAVARIADAARALAEDGAGIVGLGSLCALVGSRGESVAAAVEVPVTTGVSFTAFAAVRTLERTAAALEEKLDAGAGVALIGFPGSLAGAVAELLAVRGVRLVLAGEGKAVEKLATRLRAERGVEVDVHADPRTAIAAAAFVVSASSTGAALEPSWLPAGTVVVDVCEPRDLPGRGAVRAGVLVVDGESVSLPASAAEALWPLTRIYNAVIGQRNRTVYACFAEPIVLALEGRAERFSLGKTITPDRADEIGRLGEKHGFAVEALMHRGREVSREQLAHIAVLRRGKPAAARGARMAGSGAPS